MTSFCAKNKCRSTDVHGMKPHIYALHTLHAYCTSVCRLKALFARTTTYDNSTTSVDLTCIYIYEASCCNVLQSAFT